MSFLRRLFGTKASSDLTPQPSKHEPTEREVADNPKLFANWVKEYLVLSPSFERDLEGAPNEEQCQKMQVSNKERLLCANEFVLLRTLGACLFVQSHLGEQYYLKFRETLLPSVIDRMKSNAPPLYDDNPGEALDMYLEALKDPDSYTFSITYLDRVYPDSPKGGSIFLSGIPIHIGFNYTIMILDLVRDGFSSLLTGISQEKFADLHLNKIVEFLISRNNMMQEGKLYLFEGRQPTNPLNAITVDTAFMLIGLVQNRSDRVSVDRSTAIKIVRLAMWFAINRLFPDHFRDKTIDEVNLDVQILMLDHYLKDPDTNFTLDLMYAVHLLYSIEASGEENARITGTIAATIGLNDINDILTFINKLLSGNIENDLSE